MGKMKIKQPLMFGSWEGGQKFQNVCDVIYEFPLEKTFTTVVFVGKNSNLNFSHPFLHFIHYVACPLKLDMKMVVLKPNM